MKISKPCECCKTNTFIIRSKNKQRKYCKNCGTYINYVIQHGFRIRLNKTLVNEGVIQTVKEILLKVLNFFKKIFNDIKDAISKGVEYFMDYMEITPEIQQNEIIDFGDL